MAMNGMEMLLNSLMKSAGINPQEIMGNIEQFATALKTTIDTVHEQLTRIEAEQHVIAARLERIELALDIKASTADTAPLQIAARRD